mgnify:FL=1|tara:strand:+ start:1916 stop:2233 length:318 start_codon:yes stop_codon:yes gene_type:complete
MKIKFFFKPTSNKRFHYIPRYYDERKERLEKKKAIYSNLQSLSDDQRTEALRQQMQSRWSRASEVNKQRTNSNTRTVLLIAFILVLGYFVFNGIEGIEKVIQLIF